MGKDIQQRVPSGLRVVRVGANELEEIPTANARALEETVATNAKSVAGVAWTGEHSAAGVAQHGAQSLAGALNAAGPHRDVVTTEAEILATNAKSVAGVSHTGAYSAEAIATHGGAHIPVRTHAAWLSVGYVVDPPNQTHLVWACGQGHTAEVSRGCHLCCVWYTSKHERT